MRDRVIVLVDMDEFFLQVERQRQPSLRDESLLAMHQHGDIICVSHAARAQGVLKHSLAVNVRRSHPHVRLVSVHTVRDKVSFQRLRPFS